MKLAYVDSCVWITLIEGLETYRPIVRGVLATLARDGWELSTSDVVRLEVLIRPARLKNEVLTGIYRAVLDTNRPLAVAPSVFADALTLATRDGLKAMDALHVSVAEHHGCQRFVTTDPHFRSLTAITPEVITLPDG